jgi:hypothetical protein
MVVALGVVGVFALGSLVVCGIVALRHDHRAAGVALIIIGVLWGVLIVGGGGAAYYAFERVSADSKPVAFAPQTYHGQTGSLTVALTGPATLRARGTKSRQPYVFTTTNGTFQVPADAYSVESWRMDQRDAAGKTWTMECSSPPKLQHVQVAAGATTALGLGPPLTAKIEAKPPKKGAASFDLSVLDADSNKYSIRGPKEPGFQALDETGKVVWSGKFAYG